MVVLWGWHFLMSEVPMYPVSDEGVIFDPHQTLGPYVCPTVGGRSLLATKGMRLNAKSHFPRRARPEPYPYRGTPLIRNRLLPGSYSRTMPRAIQWTWGGLQFLMSEVPL